LWTDFLRILRDRTFASSLTAKPAVLYARARPKVRRPEQWLEQRADRPIGTSFCLYRSPAPRIFDAVRDVALCDYLPISFRCRSGSARPALPWLPFHRSLYFRPECAWPRWLCWPEQSAEEAEREKPRRARGSDDIAGVHE